MVKIKKQMKMNIGNAVGHEDEVAKRQKVGRRIKVMKGKAQTETDREAARII